MLSIPPATTQSASPALIIWAAKLTALNPEPQTLLIVIAGISSGKPDFTAACLAVFWPRPAWITLPMITSSTNSGLIPALLTASLITNAPKSTAGTSFKDPPKVPIAVLTALTITTSFIN